jgi:hypothetical protein
MQELGRNKYKCETIEDIHKYPNVYGEIELEGISGCGRTQVGVFYLFLIFVVINASYSLNIFGKV